MHNNIDLNDSFFNVTVDNVTDNPDALNSTLSNVITTAHNFSLDSTEDNTILISTSLGVAVAFFLLYVIVTYTSYNQDMTRYQQQNGPMPDFEMELDLIIQNDNNRASQDNQNKKIPGFRLYGAFDR